MATLLSPISCARNPSPFFAKCEFRQTNKINCNSTVQFLKLKTPPVSFIADKGNGNSFLILHFRNTKTHVINNKEVEVSGSELRCNDSVSEHSQSSSVSSSPSITDSLSLGIKEPTYEVIEVRHNGASFKRDISRRQLLKSSGLRLRDVRSVDPSLWVTNSMPSLLVREQAILLNLGSLRAIAMRDNVLVFDHRSKGGQAFLKTLLQRLNPKNSNGAPAMPFELEVVEAALVSRTQRLERKLMEVESRVGTLLEVLPNRLTADILEQLRVSKQALVELASRTGALRQMLLELLEDSNVIRRIAVLGRSCIVRKGDGSIECSIAQDKQIAEEEAEEVEMLLENYLQRCESCHGQAEQLLDSAREMEDSISVNLSSRRLEVSRLELLLQVGTFCTALGALVAGIFGMNLRSYLEERAFAFWTTTAFIIFGAFALFMVMHSYLKSRKIL
eukprot:TRINITY_DN3523_c0_g3_i1.p1 TRINITY_DN3523_c0_g3~~TRINITY_DN3523_c0_g3_i1.p1  ORF type:complete len:446 (-),score=65.76 TRINITY_DN3523_c0_g3_i1:246-1583(-)